MIGLSRYSEISVLPNVANDLADVCATLERLRFRTRCVADLPSRSDFMATVASFVASVPPGAHAMLYYAGHAVQVAGENFLIPTRASATDARGWLPQFVRLSELFQATERARAEFQFIVLDACRDDPDGTRVAPTVAPDAKRDNLRSMLMAVRGGPRNATPASYGIAAVRDAPRNTLVLFATGAGRSAFDGDGDRNGPLTKHLLAQVQRPQMHIDQAIKNIIRAVGDDTERRYRVRQSPSLYGTFSGEFCFNGCPQIVSTQQLEEERRRADMQLDAERQRAARAEAERERIERARREQAERSRRESVVVPTL